MPLIALLLLLSITQSFSIIYAKPLKTSGSVLSIPLVGSLDYAGSNSGNISARTVTEPLTNTAPSYLANIQIGAVTFQLGVDTGSAVTWVGNRNKAYSPTIDSDGPLDTVSITYAEGTSFTGPLYSDTMSLPFAVGDGNPGSYTFTQQFGVTEAAGSINPPGAFQFQDGLLGLGPTDLTKGTLVSDPQGLIQTVLDNIASPFNPDGPLITEAVFSLFLQPATFPIGNPTGQYNGQLIFGVGPPPAAVGAGAITTVGVTTNADAGRFWGIDLTITYGLNRLPVLPAAPTGAAPTAPGIADSGTTAVLLAASSIAKYKQYTGAVVNANGGLQLSQAGYNNLQSLYFTIGGTEFEFTKDAQTIPARSPLGVAAAAAGNVLLVLNTLGGVTPSGQQFALGAQFLQRFYTTYDSIQNQVGFATTQFTFAHTNQPVQIPIQP